MFHSAAVKLTLWYLSIIMVLSISFSVAIYHLSGSEFSKTNKRQAFYLNDRLPSPNFDSYNNLRRQDINDGLQRLKGSLVIFNIFVFLAGGGASYVLARRTLEPIEEALESQKRFTGDASHELRTPLTIMQTENEVALRNKTLTKTEAVTQLKSNLEEVAKLKLLSDGLLKLASFDGSKTIDNVVDISPVITQAIERVSKLADSKNSAITNNISPQIIHGDPESLVELIAVLLDNALKYSPSNSKIDISARKQSRMLAISIKDQGSGISNKDLPLIFDRFYQADQSRSGKNGYGLGLSIAKRIAEVHNGDIEVHSQVGKGSTFTVHLPTA